MINMGLYTDMDSKLTYLTRDPILVVLYEIYMFVVQIILLNMLIALMAESNERVRSIAKLVAQFERAKLILQWERRLHDLPRSTSMLARAMRFVSGFPAGSGPRIAQEIFPKWLHVLMPSDHTHQTEGKELVTDDVLREVHARAKSEDDNYAKLTRSLATANEENKRLSTLLVETQEQHGNLLRSLSREMTILRSESRNGQRNFLGQSLVGSAFKEDEMSVKGSVAGSEPPSLRAGSAGETLPKSSHWLAGIFTKSDGPTVEVTATTMSQSIDITAAVVEPRPAAPAPAPALAPAAPAPDSGSNSVSQPATSQTKSRAPSLLPALRGIGNLQNESPVFPLPAPLKAPPLSASDPTMALNALLAQCDGANLERARKIASSLREPGYSLKEYYSDICAAFPEMRLYFIESPSKGKQQTEEQHTSSGTTGETEYLRTVGAFFAIYWLTRIGIDGERGFSFGVDDNKWHPLTVEAYIRNNGGSSFESRRNKTADMDPQVAFFSMSPVERAVAFHDATQWDKLQQLLVDAGLLVKEFGTFRVVTDRMVGLLALTAIHDIMKIDQLLPTVQAQHAPYHNFRAGDVINDHDIALGYILEKYGSVLPSFKDLGVEMQRTIRFTQVKIGFNHGWLVQAEAAPGPLFSTFKQVIHESTDTRKSDVSMYFAHWLTDLAGAEPTPLRGSEKFVLRFPHPVLHLFISSFSLVNELVNKTETEVFEAFLMRKWEELQSVLGPLPSGKHAIALLRLILQVQHLPLQQCTITAFDQLARDDQEVLSTEMALTGCIGNGSKPQAYRCDPRLQQGGPVFLVYYSPAFLRIAARSDISSGLRMMAEIYRQARSLWPFSEGASLDHVTIRIDQMKEHTPSHIMEGHWWGEGWLLVRHNDREAIVEHRPLYSLSHTEGTFEDSVHNRPKSACRILNFWRAEDENNGEEGQFLAELAELRRFYMGVSEAPQDPLAV